MIIITGIECRQNAAVWFAVATYLRGFKANLLLRIGDLLDQPIQRHAQHVDLLQVAELGVVVREVIAGHGSPRGCRDGRSSEGSGDTGGKGSSIDAAALGSRRQ